MEIQVIIVMEKYVTKNDVVLRLYRKKNFTYNSFNSMDNECVNSPYVFFSILISVSSFFI